MNMTIDIDHPLKSTTPLRPHHRNHGRGKQSVTPSPQSPIELLC